MSGFFGSTVPALQWDCAVVYAQLRGRGFECALRHAEVAKGGRAKRGAVLLC